MSEEKLDELVAKYAIKWGGLYETGKELTGEDEEELNKRYVIELLCDALAGIDRAQAQGASKLSDAVRNAFKAETGIDIEAILSDEEVTQYDSEVPEEKQSNGERETRGPPEERYSADEEEIEDKYYSRQIDSWDGKDHGGAFRVGKISEPLRKIGVPDADIWFDQSKASKQLAEKAEINKTVLKQIPELIKNPTVIAESYDKTVMIFGKLYDENNNPIAVALRIDSTKRRNSITLVNKIRSIGTRTHNLDKLLDESAILYLGKNKKATKQWFNALGRSTPFGGTKFGYIRSISFDEGGVNRTGAAQKITVDIGGRVSI